MKYNKATRLIGELTPKQKKVVRMLKEDYLLGGTGISMSSIYPLIYSSQKSAINAMKRIIMLGLAKESENMRFRLVEIEGSESQKTLTNDNTY